MTPPPATAAVTARVSPTMISIIDQVQEYKQCGNHVFTNGRNHTNHTSTNNTSRNKNNGYSCDINSIGSSGITTTEPQQQQQQQLKYEQQLEYEQAIHYFTKGIDLLHQYLPPLQQQDTDRKSVNSDNNNDNDAVTNSTVVSINITNQ